MSSIVQVVLRGNWNEEGEEKKHKAIKVKWFGEQLQQFKYSKGFPASAAAGEAGVMKGCTSGSSSLPAVASRPSTRGQGRQLEAATQDYRQVSEPELCFSSLF